MSLLSDWFFEGARELKRLEVEVAALKADRERVRNGVLKTIQDYRLSTSLDVRKVFDALECLVSDSVPPKPETCGKPLTEDDPTFRCTLPKGHEEKTGEKCAAYLQTVGPPPSGPLHNSQCGPKPEPPGVEAVADVMERACRPDLSDRLAKAEKARDEANTENQSLRRQMDDLGGRLYRMEAKYHEQRGRAQDAEGTVEVLRVGFDEARAQAELVQRQLKEEIRHCESHQDLSSKAEAEVKRLRRAIEEAVGLMNHGHLSPSCTECQVREKLREALR